MPTTRQTMDFFAHQESARKRTTLLVVLYTIAVILICTVVAAATAILFHSSALNTDIQQPPTIQQIFLAAGIAFIVTALFIAGGAAYRISQLSSGGLSVALALGGKPINPETTDPDEKRILNVVEEMSIASGVPMPPVCIISEPAINAFAAGYSASDAVIGVTEGCIRSLNRDELQGVMAHEFSHILNADMRLNIRMIGLLNGILILTVLGHTLLRSSFYARSGRDSRNAGFAIAILAIILLVVGSIGALAARLIQAAVSREREYLADAAAVQFTRNPEGIGNALRRIGWKGATSRLRAAFASEANHMLFAEGISTAFASHPPLNKRIRRVLPDWDGQMLPPATSEHTPPPASRKTPAEKIRERLEDRHSIRAEARNIAIASLPLLAALGEPTPAHIQAARRLIDAIPQSLKDAAHDPFAARAVVYALLLDARPDIRALQYQRLQSHADPTVLKILRSIEHDALQLDRPLRLPLLDITLGALATLSPTQHARFRANLEALIEADRSLELFEWTILRVLEKHLDQRFNPPRSTPPDYYALNRLDNELTILLATLAHAGAPDQQSADHAFSIGAHHLNKPDLNIIPRQDCSFANLENAIQQLNRTIPKLKKEILTAAALTATADRDIAPAEAELLRAIADMLGVPTPPLLPGQRIV